MALPALSPDWFARSALEVAPDLVGCSLVRRFEDGTEVRGEIVETEAYTPDDPACHAYRRRTPRNEAMFGAPGTIYVYKIYGIYHCLNLVCDRPNIASAILIRALDVPQLPPRLSDDRQPLHRIAAGPGKLCRLLEIDRRLNGGTLAVGAPLWVEGRSPHVREQFHSGGRSLVQTTRIGLSQGVDLPWRWYLADGRAVSKKAKPS